MTPRDSVTSRDRVPLPVLVPTTIQGHAANFDPTKPLRQVKVFGPEYLKEGTILNRRLRDTMGTKWDLFLSAMRLRTAHERGNNYELDDAFKKLWNAMFPSQPGVKHQQKLKQEMLQDIAGFWNSPAWSKKTGPINLPPMFTAEMEKARFTLWWDARRKRFLPAIYCPDYGCALFVLGALRDVRGCLGCDRIFIPDRPNQIYCDDLCGDRHRHRKHRAPKQKAQ